MKLMGKTALVTGAGKGIGKAIAELLAEHGAAIGVNAYHQESAEASCQELVSAGYRAIPVAGDVSDQDAVNGTVDEIENRLGAVDILVNNAAAPAERVMFEDTTQEIQHDELVTLLGVFNCTRRVLPGMIKAKRGRIVNISSISGRYCQPGRAIYSAANMGIDSFTKTLAMETGQHGITVNCVRPGTIRSERFKKRSEEFKRQLLQTTTLDRFGEPEEVANAVLFLLSDLGNYVTGAVLDVDGGFTGFLPARGDSRQG